MGASVNGRGGRKRRLNADINVVPYIDVMLVLLVIFMVTAPLLTQGVDVQLPEASNAPLPPKDDMVTLTVNARGQYFLDIGQKTSSPLSDQDLMDDVSKVISQKPQTYIMVKGDKGVQYDAVIKGMSLLQAAGANKIGFVTDPKSLGSDVHR